MIMFKIHIQMRTIPYLNKLILEHFLNIFWKNSKNIFWTFQVFCWIYRLT